ncbi:MAG: hypothetical protein IJN92_08655 [Lachnospiraceae bacterium]|nr:hypothetical protein [Lachnospiraceae bacterium]
MKKTYPATRLITLKGGATLMTNGGRTKRKETFCCLIQAAGTDPEFLTDALSELKNHLEEQDIAGDFCGVRRGILEDVASGFLKHTELSCHVAMLLVYADETSMPLVRKFYKTWNASLKMLPPKE